MLPMWRSLERMEKGRQVVSVGRTHERGRHRQLVEDVSSLRFRPATGHFLGGVRVSPAFSKRRHLGGSFSDLRACFGPPGSPKIMWGHLQKQALYIHTAPASEDGYRPTEKGTLFQAKHEFLLFLLLAIQGETKKQRNMKKNGHGNTAPADFAPSHRDSRCPECSAARPLGPPRPSRSAQPRPRMMKRGLSKHNVVSCNGLMAPSSVTSVPRHALRMVREEQMRIPTPSRLYITSLLHP